MIKYFFYKHKSILRRESETNFNKFALLRISNKIGLIALLQKYFKQ